MARTAGVAVVVLSLFASALVAGCKRDSSDASNAQLELNKTLVRRWIDAGFNARNLTVVDEVFADRVTVNGSAVPRDGLKQSMGQHFAAFPDLHVTIDAVIGEGSSVGIWYTGDGTHQGTFGNNPPTGKRLRWGGVDLLTFHNGKVSSAIFLSELPIQLGRTEK